MLSLTTSMSRSCPGSPFILPICRPGWASSRWSRAADISPVCQPRRGATRSDRDLGCSGARCDDDHEDQAQVGPHTADERFERRDPARRCAQRADRRLTKMRLALTGAITLRLAPAKPSSLGRKSIVFGFSVRSGLLRLACARRAPNAAGLGNRSVRSPLRELEGVTVVIVRSAQAT